MKRIRVSPRLPYLGLTSCDLSNFFTTCQISIYLYQSLPNSHLLQCFQILLLTAHHLLFPPPPLPHQNQKSVPDLTPYRMSSPVFPFHGFISSRAVLTIVPLSFPLLSKSPTRSNLSFFHVLVHGARHDDNCLPVIHPWCEGIAV